MLIRFIPLVLCVLAVGCAASGPASRPRGKVPTSKATEFDPKSADKTLSWLSGLGEAYFTVEGSGEAAEAAREKMARQCEAQKGKEISWTATIEELRGDGVVLKPSCQPLDYDVTAPYLKGEAITSPPRTMFPAYLLSLHPVREDPDSTEPFTMKADSWVLKQKRGDKVIVTGNIARILSTPGAIGGVRFILFRISLEDYQFQPVE
jgi:hypothetical protein